jgi:hypothetical protein
MGEVEQAAQDHDPLRIQQLFRQAQQLQVWLQEVKPDPDQPTEN